jgi:hypothetical protein
MLDVPGSLLDERRRLGLDVVDEVWEGVLHMVPPPSGEPPAASPRSSSSTRRAVTDC